MKWIALAGGLLLGIAAAFHTLPYGWANDVSVSITAGMAALETGAFTAQFYSERKNGK